MSAAGCEQAFELHSHMLEQHDKALAQFASIPEIINGLKFSIDRLNDTIDRLEEKVQTQAACRATHDALNSLRHEQLATIRSAIVVCEEKLAKMDERGVLAAADRDEMRGAILFLKWSVPVLVTISIAAAKIIN